MKIQMRHFLVKSSHWKEIRHVFMLKHLVFWIHRVLKRSHENFRSINFRIRMDREGRKVEDAWELSSHRHSVWKSQKKVAFNIASEASYVDIFEWTKVYQKCQKWTILTSFWKPQWDILGDFQTLCIESLVRYRSRKNSCVRPMASVKQSNYTKKSPMNFQFSIKHEKS